MGRLLFKNMPGNVSGLRKVTSRQDGQTKFDLHLQIIRLPLGGILEERVSLHKLSLLVIDEPQLTLNALVARSEPEYLTIALLGVEILTSGKMLIRLRQKFILAWPRLGTAQKRKTKKGE